MKKLMSMMAVFLIGSLGFTSCSDDDKPEEPKLSISVSVSTMEEDDSTEGIIFSNITTPGDVVINLKSSNPEVATVPATVTIPEGKGNVKFEITAKGPGSTIISFDSLDGEVITTRDRDKATVTVAEPIPAEVTKYLFDYGHVTTVGSAWVTFHDPETDIRMFGVWGHTTSWGTADSPGESDDVKRLSIDNYGGRVVGTGSAGTGVFFAPVEYGTVINHKLDWVETGWGSPGPWTHVPYLAVEGSYSLPAGEQYIVFEAAVSGQGATDFVPGWMKINVSGNNFTLVEAYYCTNGGKFKVGQKESGLM